VNKEFPHSAQRERRTFGQRAPYERALDWHVRGHTDDGVKAQQGAIAGEIHAERAPLSDGAAPDDAGRDVADRDVDGRDTASEERGAPVHPDADAGEISGTISDGHGGGDHGSVPSLASDSHPGHVGISPRSRHRRTSILVIVMVAVLGIGAGAFAAFFDSASSTVSIGAGEVEVEWSTSVSSSLTVPIPSILPGQTVDRVVELRNTGSLAVSDLQVVITAATADNSDGLQLAISDCSVPWSGSTSFTCGGVETVVSADRPLRAIIALPSLGSHQAGGSDFLRMRFRLPASAPSGLQYSSTTVNFEVLGNHAVGGQR
jgi:hypothetical protein